MESFVALLGYSPRPRKQMLLDVFTPIRMMVVDHAYVVENYLAGCGAPRDTIPETTTKLLLTSACNILDIGRNKGSAHASIAIVSEGHTSLLISAQNIPILVTYLGAQ